MKKILLSIFVLSLLVPVFAFASFDTSLKYGSKGSAVTELQDFLQNQGVYSGKVDGWFGLGTLKAELAINIMWKRRLYLYMYVVSNNMFKNRLCGFRYYLLQYLIIFDFLIKSILIYI